MSDELVAEYADLCDRQSAILRRVANALNGPPPPLTSWSHHDLGEKAEALKAEVERSKPRTISTVAELDALPVGAVVYAANHIGPAERFKVGWMGCGNTSAWTSGLLARDGLPATVLHEGATE